jgi:putative phosphoribosyl transferase
MTSIGGERRFRDRREAGRALGAELARRYAGRDPIVLGLARGGIPVASEVARALGAPLDVLVVRKLGAPFNPEFAIGALAPGARVLRTDVIGGVGLRDDEIARVIEREEAELGRRERLYRAGRPRLDLAGKIAVLVDDGIATGATMEAAVKSVRAASASHVVVAAPTASREAVAELRRIADAVEVLRVPEPYLAVGLWYVDFEQLTDEEVVDLLERSRREATEPARP